MNFNLRLQEFEAELETGSALPPELTGLFMVSRAHMTSAQIENMLTLTNLSWKIEDIEKAMRRMGGDGFANNDKDDKSGKVFAVNEVTSDLSSIFCFISVAILVGSISVVKYQSST